MIFLSFLGQKSRGHSDSDTLQNVHAWHAAVSYSEREHGCETGQSNLPKIPLAADSSQAAGPEIV